MRRVRSTAALPLTGDAGGPTGFKVINRLVTATCSVCSTRTEPASPLIVTVLMGKAGGQRMNPRLVSGTKSMSLIIFMLAGQIASG